MRGWRAAFLPPPAAITAGAPVDALEAVRVAAAAGGAGYSEPADGGEAAAQARFDTIDTQGDGTIDVVEWTQCARPATLGGRACSRRSTHLQP